MKSLDYQINAVKKLIETSHELLDLEGNHTLIFKAPTGSGKTIMMAEFLKEFIIIGAFPKAKGANLKVIWPTILVISASGKLVESIEGPPSNFIEIIEKHFL